jgi:hypothetical protein
MKSIFVLLVTLSIAAPSLAQDSAKQVTQITRIGYVTGATLLFSLADYIGFNVMQPIPKLPVWYRPTQFLLQCAITYFLYEKLGLSSAIAFNVIWWTWGADLSFYGWIDAFNEGGTWGGRTRNELYEHHITWADWTPVGLLRPSGANIANSTLYGQAAGGFAIALSILW